MSLVLHHQSIDGTYYVLVKCMHRRTTVKNLVKSFTSTKSVGCKSVKGHRTDW